MNKPDVQHSAQSAAHAQDHAAASKHGAAGLSSSKPALKPEGKPNAHVCTDACTHEGAKGAPSAAKTGNETVAMGSPALGLGGRPVPKDAINKYT